MSKFKLYKFTGAVWDLQHIADAKGGEIMGGEAALVHRSTA